MYHKFQNSMIQMSGKTITEEKKKSESFIQVVEGHLIYSANNWSNQDGAECH